MVYFTLNSHPEYQRLLFSLKTRPLIFRVRIEGKVNHFFFNLCNLFLKIPEKEKDRSLHGFLITVNSESILHIFQVNQLCASRSRSRSTTRQPC